MEDSPGAIAEDALPQHQAMFACLQPDELEDPGTCRHLGPAPIREVGV
jgi:hypothetical protein